MAKIAVSAGKSYSSIVKVKSITPVDDFTAQRTESTFPVPLNVQTVLVYNSKPSAPANTSVNASQTYWITG
jgi:hypothetical protein